MMRGQDTLPHGQPIRLVSGGTGIVGELIGSGGQGAVYAVESGGRRLALKWYHPQVALADIGLRSRITRMVAHGPPDQSFLWPLDLAEIPRSPSFGYVMPFMSGDRQPLQNLFAAPPRRINPPLDVRAAACFDIATSFQNLHATGYCYQDINFGGFFIDPQRGSVQICDADNIAVDGEPGGVYGTRKFMAPEVVRREALPSTRTDLYSMAVLFFYMIFNWHPLDGKREAEATLMDQATELRLYGRDPCFLFDPVNDANGPVPKLHDWVVARWAAMTEPVRALFTRAFTTGLQQRDARPVESEWRRALAQLRESTIACGGCGFEHGVDYARLQKALACSACTGALQVPPVLAVGRDVVLLTPRREIYPHHLHRGVASDDETAVAVVDVHPRDPSILGLRNASGSGWAARTAEGASATIAPGRTLRIAEGTVIDFGGREGRISGVANAAQQPRPAMGSAA